MLVDALTELLERYRKSSYRGYGARFLGLVHVKTFEQNISWGLAKVKNAFGEPKEWSPSTFKRLPSHRKALDYLTAADKAGLWPRTTAIQHLAGLHVLSRDWDKAAACCETLRAKHAEIGGARLTDELERDIKRNRAKLERREREEDT